MLMIFEVALEGDAKESRLMYFVECFISDFEFNLTLQSFFIGVRREKYSEVLFKGFGTKLLAWKLETR